MAAKHPRCFFTSKCLNSPGTTAIRRPHPRTHPLTHIRPMDFESWVAVPGLETPHCGRGNGMAACPALGVLVTSDTAANTLAVFRLPTGAAAPVGDRRRGGLVQVCQFGGPLTRALMHFRFPHEQFHESGWLAFSDGAEHHLLVTDHRNDVVHVIDVARRCHIGYVGARGSIPGPRGVATKGSLAAVTSWDMWDCGDHVVRVYVGRATDWVLLRRIAGGFGVPGGGDGQLAEPLGLRFTRDGSGLAVADWGNSRACLFSVADGSFVRHLVTDLQDSEGGPVDLEEYGGGWLITCGFSADVRWVDADGSARCILGGGNGNGPGRRGMQLRRPGALALVPGLGVAVREDAGDKIKVLASPDTIAMAAMSTVRVAWMGAVSRATPCPDKHPLWGTLHPGL